MMERTASPAKNELVISGDCKESNVTWSADLDEGCVGEIWLAEGQGAKSHRQKHFGGPGLCSMGSRLMDSKFPDTCYLLCMPPLASYIFLTPSEWEHSHHWAIEG